MQIAVETARLYRVTNTTKACGCPRDVTIYVPFEPVLSPGKSVIVPGGSLNMSRLRRFLDRKWLTVEQVDGVVGSSVSGTPANNPVVLATQPSLKSKEDEAFNVEKPADPNIEIPKDIDRVEHDVSSGAAALSSEAEQYEKEAAEFAKDNLVVEGLPDGQPATPDAVSASDIEAPVAPGADLTDADIEAPATQTDSKPSKRQLKRKQRKHDNESGQPPAAGTTA